MRFLLPLFLIACHKSEPSRIGLESLPNFFNLDYADQHECITHTFQDGKCLVSRVICRDAEYNVGVRCTTTEPLHYIRTEPIREELK